MLALVLQPDFSLQKTSLRPVTKYRKYIFGVRVVLWGKDTEYIWVGQLITHQGDMHIIWPYAVTCHIRPSPYERVDGKGTGLKGHHTLSSHKNKFWKYRYNILHSVLQNCLRRNRRRLTFSSYPWNTMVYIRDHVHNTMSTSGILITQEYNFHLEPKSNSPISYF